MSEFKAEELAKRLTVVMRDFPNYILFCVGKDGFCHYNIEDIKRGEYLAAQIKDTLSKNPSLFKLFDEIIFEIKVSRKKEDQPN